MSTADDCLFGVHHYEPLLSIKQSELRTTKLILILTGPMSRNSDMVYGSWAVHFFPVINMLSLCQPVNRLGWVRTLVHQVTDEHDQVNQIYE